MEKNILKLFLAFFFFALSLFLSEFGKPASAHTETVVVEMTSDGFKPNEITIDATSSVNFVNKDTKAHWPASDPHPIHSDYSQFDPRKPIPAGSFWLFKPENAGIWKFHDHLSPHQKGTLTVVEEKTSEESQTKNDLEETDQESDKTIKNDQKSESLWTKIKSFFINVFTKIKDLFVKKK